MTDRQSGNLKSIDHEPRIRTNLNSKLAERSSGQAIKIAVVGDVHDLWDSEDEVALKQLGVDLVLLVGDFGNEAVDVVSTIAAIDLPKAVALGNHDAWYSATEWGMKKCPYDRQHEDRVQQQLDLLGETHVGYSKLDFPQFQLTVVGSRPFSWGGSEWKNTEFYQSRFQVTSFEESIARMMAAVDQASFNTIIFLGHCGPTGLGDAPEAPCGRDWKPLGGDFGDPDFRDAIEQTRKRGKAIPLVTFGHMHHQLRHTRQHLRTPIVVDSAGTVYLNAASVPRIKQESDQQLRNFSLVTLQSGTVTQAAIVWVNQQFEIVSEQVVFEHTGLFEAAG